MERTNARLLEPGDLEPGALAGRGKPEPALLVMDVSFISATLLLGPVLAAAPSLAEAVVLVKPQFESGAETWARAASFAIPRRTSSQSTRSPSASARWAGRWWETIPSPITGAEGNKEFLLYARRAGA